MIKEIKCPQCNNIIDLSKEASKIFNQEKDDLERAKKEFERKKNKQNEIVKEILKKKLKEKEDQIREEEQEKRKQQERDFQKKENDLKRKENSIRNMEEDLKLKNERYLIEKEKEIEIRGKKKAEQEFELERLKNKEEKEDMKKGMTEMKRKLEQGSQQQQGEIQEIAIEEHLKKNYLFDIIEEVPKGRKGADIIQTVRNNYGQECGKIIYESKRTKAFSEEWIEKLKEDQARENANISILVTQTMPKNMLKSGTYRGIYICEYSALIVVVPLIREGIIKVHETKEVQQNKESKMEALYKYLSDNRFKQIINSIIENQQFMSQQLDKEKAAMERIWAERRRRIEMAQEKIITLYGDIKAIGGNSISDIENLQLPS